MRDWKFLPLPESPIFKNLTGEKYNRLLCLGYVGFSLIPSGTKVHRYAFRCDCGNEIEASGGNVKSGKHKSCGCLSREQARLGNSTNLVGLRFGRLLAIERIPTSHNIKRTKYRCVCDCGQEKIISGEVLSYGDSKSCGCLRRELFSKRNIKDLTGKKFGLLTAIERAEDSIGVKKIVYRCKCACGNEITTTAANLYSLKTRSCGCIHKNRGKYAVEYDEKQKTTLIINNMRSLVRLAFHLKGVYKKSKTFAIIGCSPEEFREHLILLFEEGMTLSNHGEWHIDHKIPVSYAKTEDDLYVLNHFLNLRPLWRGDNLIKSDTLPENVDTLFAELKDKVLADRLKKGLPRQ